MSSLTGIILAGGKGSRLGGTNKALLDIGGVSTLDRVRASFSGLVTETIVVVNDDALATTSDLHVLRDPEPHGGVLPALLAALAGARSSLAALVACDMPFLSAALLRQLVLLAADRDVVIPDVGGQLQPMHAIYRREPCRVAIAAALARGDRRMTSFLDDVRVRRVPEAEVRLVDPDLRSFFNINTPDDLAEARQLARRFARDAEPSAHRADQASAQP